MFIEILQPIAVFLLIFIVGYFMKSITATQKELRDKLDELHNDFKNYPTQQEMREYVNMSTQVELKVLHVQISALYDKIDDLKTQLDKLS